METTGKKFKWKQAYTVPVILVAIWVILGFATTGFATTSNIVNLLRQTSVLGVAAIGASFVIISGETDLSVGSVMGVAGMMVTTFISMGWPIPVAVIVTLIGGTAIGMLNGIIVRTTGIPSFIATMGTMTAFRGIAEIISGGLIVSGMPAEYKSFSSSTFLGIPLLVWIFIVVAVVFGVLLSKTLFGRNVYAVGSNAAVAQLSGISVNKIKIAAFAISGFCGALAGLMFSLRMGQGLPTAGAGYELDCIASAVIGGASFTGGEGIIFGTVVGSFLIQTLQNGGNLLGISSFSLEVVTGIVLIVAVAIDTISKRKRK